MNFQILQGTEPRKTYEQALDSSPIRRTSGHHLQLWQIIPLQELDEAWNHALADDFLDGRVALCDRCPTLASDRRYAFAGALRVMNRLYNHSPMERSLRNCAVASNWTFGSSLQAPWTMVGRLSSCKEAKARHHTERTSDVQVRMWR